MLRLSAMALCLLFMITACGPTPQTRELDLPELYEAAPRGPLPEGVRPTYYKLDLTLDPAQTRFNGRVTMDVEFDRPATGFWLHGQGLQIRDVRVSSGTLENAEASWRDVLGSGVAWIGFPRRVSPGVSRIEISYSAPFDENLSGLFRVEEQGNAYALAKSESIQARRFMPGFDEPRFKTPYDILLTVPQTDMAISNTPIVSRELIEGDDMARVTFKRTRPLPTYLLSLAVGNFDQVNGPAMAPNEVRGVEIPLTGYTRAGKGDEISYALMMTEPMIAYFERQLGIPYPYQKLDIIAAPQWPSGATELAAAITYRESRILYGPTSGPAARRSLLGIHSHEIAHMWFGDLVTPPWWDDLWLKEAFASWATGIVLNELEPEGGYELEAVSEAVSAMGLDSLESARAVREPITLNEDIRNAYDSITYDKGLAVIAMVDSYFGAETFRPALGRYIASFEDSVADSGDFFEIIARETREPDLTKAFRSFVEQNGLPTLETELQCKDGQTPQVKLKQSRYKPLGSPISETRKWTIPFCLAAEQEGGRERHCMMIDSESATMKLAGEETCPAWIMPNAGGRGYWRFTMSDAQWALLAVNMQALEPAEALTAIDSARASFEAGQLSLSSLMAIINAGSQRSEQQVLNEAISAYASLHPLLTGNPEALEGYQAELNRIFMPLFVAVEDPQTERDTLMKGRLESFLGRVGNNAAIREELGRAANSYVGLPVRGDVRQLTSDDFSTALAIGMQDGGKPFLEALVSSLDDVDDPTFNLAAAYAIGENKDPALLPDILDLAMSGTLGTRETYSVISGQMREHETRPQTWAWLRTNFPAFIKLIPGQRPRSTPRLASRLCYPGAVDEMETLFETYGDLAPGYERALAEARENIGLCVAFRNEKEAELVNYFSRLAPSETTPDSSN